MIGAAILLPLLLVVFRRGWLMPVVPLPALALALAGPAADSFPALLMGIELRLDGTGRLMLGVTAGIWAVAGTIAAREGRRHRLAGFWGLTLAGNLGVCVAADAVTFYLAFAVVSLAAWGLVIHDRTPEALRAGRVYLVMAVVGEVALLSGLMLVLPGAANWGLEAVRAAAGPWAAGLMLAGLGLKAGMLPLHVWLALAHPAAPVPASAVLSGAIVATGAFGIAAMVPPSAGGVLMGLGFAGAFAAALYGLTQADVKAVLAYSTISQMGLVLALIGAGAGPVAMLYAAHHGLAKAALFLSVAAGRAGAWMAALAALSLAGAPLTGGAVSKAAGKAALPGWAEMALALSGVGTTLVLVWALLLLARKPARPGVSTGLAVAALSAAALALPWALAPGLTGQAPGHALSNRALVDAAWPIGAGLALAGLGAMAGLRAPALPPGDLLELRRRRLAAIPWPGMPPLSARTQAAAARAWAALAVGTARLEVRLLLWRWSGLLILGLLLALAVAAG